jgi:hypothetical protein
MILPLCFENVLAKQMLRLRKKVLVINKNYLDTVVARGDSSILYFDINGRMRELALRVRSGAFLTLKLPADLQLQPSRVFAVE